MLRVIYRTDSGHELHVLRPTEPLWESWTNESAAALADLYGEPVTWTAVHEPSRAANHHATRHPTT